MHTYYLHVHSLHSFISFIVHKAHNAECKISTIDAIKIVFIYLLFNGFISSDILKSSLQEADAERSNAPPIIVDYYFDNKSG